MSIGFTDTSDEARAVQLKVLREMGAERRSLMGTRWSDAIRGVAMQGIRSRHRDFDDRRVVLEFARLTLSEQLFEEAFGAELAARK